MSSAANVNPHDASLASAALAVDDTAADKAVKALSLTLFGASIAFFSAVTAISYIDPGYFERLLFERFGTQLDQVTVGSTEKADSAGVTAIPVPQIVRPSELTPQDFSIVMVFQNEAHLASPGELWHVRVGSVLPGLGEILDIETTDEGGLVIAKNATLKAMKAASSK